MFVNLRYLWLKLLKYKENNREISDTFDQTTKYTCTFIYDEPDIIQ